MDYPVKPWTYHALTMQRIRCFAASDGEGDDWKPIDVKLDDAGELAEAGWKIGKAALTGKNADILGAVPVSFQASERSPEISVSTVMKANPSLKKKLNDSKSLLPKGQWRDEINDGLNGIKKRVENPKTLSGKRYLTAKKVNSGISQASLIVAGLDMACQFLGLPNPVDELIRKPFFGDWDQLSESSDQWKGLSDGLGGVGDAVTQAAADVRDGIWQGEASDAFAQCCQTFDSLFEAGVAPCSEIAEALDALAELAQTTFDLVLTAVETFADLAMGIEELVAAGALAWTGVGAVVFLVKGVDLAFTIQQAADVVNDAVKAISEVADACADFLVCTATMSALVERTNGVLMIAAK
jgi:uncharacterized protein YukE